MYDQLTFMLVLNWFSTARHHTTAAATAATEQGRWWWYSSAATGHISIACGRMSIDKIGQIQVQFPDGHINVIWIDAQTRLRAIGIFLQSFAIGTFQRDRLEQNDHYQVKAPNFVGLSQTVDASHFPFLIGIREYAYRLSFARDALHKIFPTLLGDVFA